jgi:hypothetical protein
MSKVHSVAEKYLESPLSSCLHSRLL